MSHPAATPATPATASTIPEGFKPRNFGAGFIGTVGPLYSRRIEGGVQLG